MGIWNVGYSDKEEEEMIDAENKEIDEYNHKVDKYNKAIGKSEDPDDNF